MANPYTGILSSAPNKTPISWGWTHARALNANAR